MASAYQSDEDPFPESECDEEKSSESGSDGSEESDSDGDSDVEADFQVKRNGPCKYYNKGKCRDGDRCSYLHVCEYALKGNCRYGSKCKLNHPRGGRQSSRASNRARSTSSGEEERSASTDSKLTDGRLYQWQLNDGNGWMDVDNDHIIEAQYSLPHTKSIKIYNTPYGAVSIDFNRMTVHGKRLRVRRLDDGRTVWIWYCTLRRKWIKYGAEDSKGNPSPVKSSDIENKFQSNPTSSFTFTTCANTFEIKFREMRQVSTKRKRKVTRRPLYRQQPEGVSQAAAAFQNISVGTKPQWQFEGDSGEWHVFKHRSRTPTECSITSDEIERKYQLNPRDSMTFKVKTHLYKLDFAGFTENGPKERKYPVSGSSVGDVDARGERRMARLVGADRNSNNRLLHPSDDPDQPEDQSFTPGQACAGVRIKAAFEDFEKSTNNIKAFTVNHIYDYKQDVASSNEEHEGETDSWQETAVNGKHYEWQLSNGHQWLPIQNDHVIETHYCQPGAKGITINLSQRPVFIDFDKMQTLTAALKVQRLSFLPQGQTEDVGWYFRDDQRWREYGSRSSSMLSSSISSGDVERQFTLDPRGTFSFTVGSTGYSLHFSTMTQTNCITGLRRNVRRRPKFTSNAGSSGTMPRWQFQDIGGIWKDYCGGRSISSQDIELQYRQTPSGTMMFTTKHFSYELSFSAMTQRNLSTNTTRSVRRLNR